MSLRLCALYICASSYLRLPPSLSLLPLGHDANRTQVLLIGSWHASAESFRTWNEVWGKGKIPYATPTQGDPCKNVLDWEGTTVVSDQDKVRTCACVRAQERVLMHACRLACGPNPSSLYNARGWIRSSESKKMRMTTEDLFASSKQTSLFASRSISIVSLGNLSRCLPWLPLSAPSLMPESTLTNLGYKHRAPHAPGTGGAKLYTRMVYEPRNSLHFDARAPVHCPKHKYLF